MRVTKRMKDDNGNPVGRAHQNPILDTRMFEVKFLDGTKEAMATNVIAQNMFAQVDEVLLIDRLRIFDPTIAR